MLCYTHTDGLLELMQDGSLMIQINDKWGRICDISWTLSDADVACRQLGYSRGAIYAHVLPGKGWINLEQVDCTGEEATLLDCSAYPVSGTPILCNHGNDVALECSPSSKNDIHYYAIYHIYI